MAGARVMASVANPSAELKRAIHLKKLRRAHITQRNGLVVASIRLLVDTLQTVSLAPKRWELTGNDPCRIDSYRLNNADDPLDCVYEIPDLIRAQDDVVFECMCTECDFADKTGYKAVVVTGQGGQRLRPFSVGQARAGKSRHLEARFSAPSLAQVDMHQSKSTKVCRLAIRQNQLRIQDGYVVRQRTTIVSDLIVPGLPEMPLMQGELAIWQPAVSAIYGRLTCPGNGCRGHYLR